MTVLGGIAALVLLALAAAGGIAAASWLINKVPALVLGFAAGAIAPVLGAALVVAAPHLPLGDRAGETFYAAVGPVLLALAVAVLVGFRALRLDDDELDSSRRAFGWGVFAAGLLVSIGCAAAARLIPAGYEVGPQWLFGATVIALEFLIEMVVLLAALPENLGAGSSSDVARFPGWKLALPGLIAVGAMAPLWPVAAGVAAVTLCVLWLAACGARAVYRHCRKRDSRWMAADWPHVADARWAVFALFAVVGPGLLLGAAWGGLENAMLDGISAEKRSLVYSVAAGFLATLFVPFAAGIPGESRVDGPTVKDAGIWLGVGAAGAVGLVAALVGVLGEHTATVFYLTLIASVALLGGLVAFATDQLRLGAR